MKHTFVISQLSVVRAGFLGRLGFRELALLDYLHGWVACGKAVRRNSGEHEYTWIDFSHAIDELPLLFNPTTVRATRKNQLTLLIKKLRNEGLIETIRANRYGKPVLFFRLTDTGRSLASSRQSTITKTTSTVTLSRDEHITQTDDESITPGRDNNNEEDIKESNINETASPSPSGNEVEAVVSYWNSLSILPKIQQLTAQRRNRLSAQWEQPFFRNHWKEGIERLTQSSFCTGQGARGWRADLDWFLRPDTLTSLLEGKYDDRRPPTSPPTSKIIEQDHFQGGVGKL